MSVHGLELFTAGQSCRVVSGPILLASTSDFRPNHTLVLEDGPGSGQHHREAEDDKQHREEVEEGSQVLPQ